MVQEAKIQNQGAIAGRLVFGDRGPDYYLKVVGVDISETFHVYYPDFYVAPEFREAANDK